MFLLIAFRIGFIERVFKSGIIVLNISQCSGGMVNQTKYETGIGLKNIGVVSGGDMTTEAAITKMMFLLARYPKLKDIKKIINDYSLLAYYKSNTSTAARLEGEAAGISIEINTTLLLEYLNHLHKLKTTIVQDKAFYEDIEKSAERLIDLIKKEYHLK